MEQDKWDWVDEERAQRRVRTKDPFLEKQADYKHQRRTSEGGQAWRKVRASLPREERKRYRLAQERALQQTVADLEDQGVSASDEVSGLKRKYFRLLWYRREIALGKKVTLRTGKVRVLGGWYLPVGHKVGRRYRPSPGNIVSAIERERRMKGR